MANRIAYPLGTPPVWHGMARVEKVLGGPVAITAADLGTNGNTVAIFKAPANFNVVGASIDSPGLDSNGSPALTVSLGDALSPTRFLNASTAFRAGAAGIAIANGARGYRYTADTDIILTFPAAAATAVAGTVVVYLHGYIDP